VFVKGSSGVLFVASGKRHSPVVWSRVPMSTNLLFLVIWTACSLKVAMQPASHSFPIEIRELCVRPGILHELLWRCLVAV
jgi:hypothetical protein